MIALCLLGKAQDGDFTLGARSRGMAGIGTVHGDGMSLFNNIGGIGLMDKSVAAISYQNRYGIPAFRVVGLSYIHHSSFLNAGLSFFRFGDELYNQQKVGIGIGNKLGMVSLGASANVIQYRIEGLGSRQVFIMEFGGIVTVLPKLKLGAHIFNINLATLSDVESVPVIMKIGIGFEPNESLLLSGEIRKDPDQPTNLILGLEYQIIDGIYARTGFQSEPQIAAFGVGTILANFQFDYAYNIRNPLGGIHEITLNIFLSN